MKNPRKNKFLQSKYLPWLILGLILVVAIFLRFYKLNSLPPGLHPDEAANGLDIVQRIFHGDIRIVYNTNGPRESLFFFLQAIFVAMMGNTILALRMAPAIIGVLAVFVTYLWAKDWFGRRVGLIAAGIFSINVWAITVTRDGFRASMTPLMVALVMWLGGKAFKSGKTVYFILAGLVLGVGCYTYTAFDILVFGAVVMLGFLFFARRKWLMDNLQKIGLAIITFLIIISPLAYLTIRHPGESTTARAGGTSVLNSGLNSGNPVQTLFSSAGKTLLQFNWRGDENSRHNTPGEPMLDTFIGLMFILGLVITIIHLNRPKYFALLVVFGAMLGSAILTAEGIPHGLRTIGSAPAVFILAAIGVNFVLVAWYKTFPVNAPARYVGLYLVLILLCLSAIKSYKQYFIAWAQDPRTYAAYSENAAIAGKYLISHAQPGQTDLVYVDGYTDKTIAYLTYHKVDYTRLDDDTLKNLPLSNGKKLFLVLGSDTGKDQQVIELIKAKFPGGTLGEVNSTFDGQLLFYTYQVGS